VKKSREKSGEEICPFCQTGILPGERKVRCPVCDMPHHDECWKVNKGCTVYGCKGKVIIELLPDNDELLESQYTGSVRQTRHRTGRTNQSTDRTGTGRNRDNARVNPISGFRSGRTWDVLDYRMRLISWYLSFVLANLFAAGFIIVTLLYSDSFIEKFIITVMGGFFILAFSFGTIASKPTR
jgi:hypothetical protein